EPEGQCARADRRARGYDRGGVLRRSALSAAAALVRQRRGRALMPGEGAAADVLALDARRLTAAVASVFACLGLARGDATIVAGRAAGVSQAAPPRRGGPPGRRGVAAAPWWGPRPPRGGGGGGGGRPAPGRPGAPPGRAGGGGGRPPPRPPPPPPPPQSDPE